MKALKFVESPEIEESVKMIHAIYGEDVLPEDKVKAADSLKIWVESFEDEDTIYTLLDSEGEVIFEARIS